MRAAAARDRAITVELAAGDALFLPKLWWHQVEATAPVNVMLNYWWDATAIGPDAIVQVIARMQARSE